MFSFTLLAYGAVVSCVFLATYARHKDVLHPVIYFAPMLGFVYAFMPWTVRAADPVTFEFYVGGDDVLGYQALVFMVTIALLLGISIGARHISYARVDDEQRNRLLRKQLYRLGVLIGLIGFAGFLYIVTTSGGFYRVYGIAYGGGMTSSGYINELRFVGLGAIPLIYMGRRGRGMRFVDWMLIAVVISPILIQGLLGARRGPTFLAVVAVAGGWIYFFNKKVPLIVTIAGGLTLGMLMLFLVSNRGAIFLGSDLPLESSAGAILQGVSGSEYVYGGAVVRYADATNGYFYGARIAAHLVGRIIPGAIWPTQFEDVQNFFNLNVDLTINAGIDAIGISRVVGWMPPIGAAPGIVAELWLEFGIFAFAAAFTIGWFYGNVWRRAKTNEPAKVLYIIMMALSIYLIMQSLEAWSYRLLLFGMPTYLLARTLHRRSDALARAARTLRQPLNLYPRNRPE